MRPLLGLLLGLLLAAPAAAQPSLTVGSSQRAVEATAGSGCSTENGAGVCSDAGYPLRLEGELPVRRGHRIVLDFGHAVEEVTVTGLAVTREHQSPRWSGAVPRDLPYGSHRLGVLARWAGGDRHFEVGVRVLRPRRGHARMPRLAGLSQIDAVRALERRGLWWRFGRSGPRFFDSGPPVPPGALMALGPPIRTQSIRPGRRVARGTLVRLGLRAAASAAGVTIGSSLRSTQAGGTLEVRAGNRIAFDFDRPVASVTVTGISARAALGRHWAHPHWAGTLPASTPAGDMPIVITADGERYEAVLRVLPRPPARVRVPRITGLGIDDALQRLERLGLRWRIAGDRVRDRLEPPFPVRAHPSFDTVERQLPRSGRRVRRGAVVRLQTACSLSAARGRGCA